MFSSISLSIIGRVARRRNVVVMPWRGSTWREQRVRRAVELRNGDDVAAGVGEIDKGEMQRGLAGRDRERADAAFEFGDARFKHRGGRVGDPAVADSLRLSRSNSAAPWSALSKA